MSKEQAHDHKDNAYLWEENTELRVHEANQPEAGEEAHGDQLPFLAPVFLTSETAWKVEKPRTRAMKSLAGQTRGILPRRTYRNQRESCQASDASVTQGIIVSRGWAPVL